MSKFSKMSSAEVMALVRTIGNKETDKKLQAGDYLAELFLPRPFRFALNLSAVRNTLKSIYAKKIPGGFPYIVAKSRAIDDLLEEALSEGSIQQLVFLGAGYDTRAYRYKEQLTRTRIFEIDHPEILERKKSLIDKRQLNLDNLIYCAADFEGKDEFTTHWLQEQGIKLDVKTLFIIDGVSYFISPEAFDNVVEVITQFKEGSELIFDYAYHEILENKTYRGSEEFKASLEGMGEPVVNGIKENEISTYLRSFNLKMLDLFHPDDLEQNYLTGSNGQSTKPYGFLDIVRAKV
ncbi:class I SAM-dependent methyltransferase [Marinomonas sp. PE14-40]|uniref:class I SAM-dependent methyltransferase n=1 Tax=Marinomonas sp. PE14-40 TaxID=3060621 RepID=UPI003F67B7AD